jgi:hypothetical protein
MLNDLFESAPALINSEWAKVGIAAAGFAAWVGIYYLGEYLFSDREPESDFSAE